MKVDSIIAEMEYRSSAADLAIGQGDTERAAWLAARCGKLTASYVKTAMDFKKNGEPTQARSNLMRDLLAERLTGLNMRHYVNPAMEWGILTEPEAKVAYTAATGTPLHPSGFYDHPIIDMFGATPDAEIGREGLCEIKCPTTGTFTDWVMAGVVPEEHKPQMLAQLACTGRKWVEFVAFDPKIKDEKRRLFVRRYEPKPEDITSIELHAQTFLNELDAMWESFVSAA